MKDRRRNRKKSASGGMGTVRKSASPAASTFFNFPSLMTKSMLACDRAQRAARRKSLRKKSVSASDVIQSWRNVATDESEKKAPEKGGHGEVGW